MNTRQRLKGYMKGLATNTAWGARRFGFVSVYGHLRSRMVKRQVAIVQYHRIDEAINFPFSLVPATPQDFDLDMGYLRQNYQVISLEELCASLGDLTALPPNTAVVTIDDGYRDIYLHAYPILKKYGVPATVFLTTGHIGTPNPFWWDKVKYVLWHTKLQRIRILGLDAYPLGSVDERRWAAGAVSKTLKQMPDDKRNESIEELVRHAAVDIPQSLGKDLILSWDEIREMSRNGVSFGAHTIHHPILTKIPLEDARREILGSKQHIERELGCEVVTFCYPNGRLGDRSEDIEEILRSSGFKGAVTSAPSGFVPPTAQPYRLPRIRAAYNHDIFELFMSGVDSDLVAVWRRLVR